LLCLIVCRHIVEVVVRSQPSKRDTMAKMTLEQLLDRLTVEGELYERLPDNTVRCYACGHRCLIRDGRRGICKVRFNQGGVLQVPFGYVGALQCDPTEKKPFFHVYPGSDTLTFGMLGCDFHCPYCQNWVTSQALRDPASESAGAYPRELTPAELIQSGLRMGAKLVGAPTTSLITMSAQRSLKERISGVRLYLERE
jgi:pyruvate formate lyase activating enzyme